jgi:hypothetical protein
VFTGVLLYLALEFGANTIPELEPCPWLQRVYWYSPRLIALRNEMRQTYLKALQRIKGHTILEVI